MLRKFFAKTSALLLVLTVGCGAPESHGRKEFINYITVKINDSQGYENREQSELGFPLNAEADPVDITPNTQTITPASYIVSISGCASGYTKVHDSALLGSSISMIAHDTKCVAALRSFYWDNLTWTKDGGGDFSGAGRVAFINTVDSRRLFVANPKTLPSPIIDNSEVSFVFHTILSGLDKNLIIPGARQELTSTSGAYRGPFVRWFSAGGRAALVNIQPLSTPANRATFKVKFECQGTFTKKATAINSTCQVGTAKQTMSNLYFRIVEDIYNGSPSIAQLTALFGGKTPPTRTAPVVKITKAAQIWGKTGTAAGGVVLDLTTDNSLLGCRSYLIVTLQHISTMKNTSAWAFTWHNLDFSTNKSTCP